MRWEWKKVCDCNDKFIQRSVSPTGEVRVVKVPSKLMVVFQSAAASSSSSAGGGGKACDGGEDRNTGFDLAWLPTIAELARHLPKDMVNFDRNKITEVASSLSGLLPPDLNRAVESLLDVLKGGGSENVRPGQEAQEEDG